MAASFKHLCAAPGKLVLEASSFSEKKTRHTKVIQDHYFNYSVSLVIPGYDRLPDILVSQLSNEKAFVIQQLPVSALIQKEFIEAFVKKGHIYMLSHGTWIDTEDCAALLPTGHLILNVTKDTYEQLGLEGRPSVCGGKKPGKYVIDIDMTQPYFTPGKKNYTRVKTCLEQNFPLKFNFLLTWMPDDEQVCPSSVAQYFERRGFRYEELNMKQTRKTHREIDVPDIINTHTDSSTDTCGWLDFYEWLGFVSLNCNISGSSDNYVSSYVCPSPHTRQRYCTCYRVEGMFTASTVQSVLDSVRSHVHSQGAPWAAMTVHGFADSPVSWQSREHGFQNSGENLYTFVIFPNQGYWLFSAVDSTDICP